NYYMHSNRKQGSFIANWQDERTPDVVSFDGLLDDVGRSKIELYKLANHWKSADLPVAIPELKILTPAVAVTERQSVTYHILVRDSENWRLLKEDEGFALEWRLIETNRYGDPLRTMS